MMVALELWHYVELQGGDLIASAGFSREKMRLFKKDMMEIKEYIIENIVLVIWYL